MSESERDFAEEGEVSEQEPHEQEVDETEERSEPQQEEVSEEPSDEEPKQKKSRPRNFNPYKTKLNQAQRDKFQAINEAQRLQQENDLLRQQMDLSNQTGMYHYENAVEQRIASAEKMQEQAIESGDVRAQVSAQKELADAVSEKRRIMETKAQQSIQQQQQQQFQQYYNQIPQAPQYKVDEYQKNEVSRWATRNPYFDPKRAEYDPHLSSAVEAYAERLENTLIQTGREHLICTRDYFNELDRYAQTFYEDKPTNFNTGRQLNMKPSGQYVSPPSRGSMNSGAGSNQDNFSAPINGVPADHIRDMAKRLGIPEKEYRNMMKNDTSSKGGR